LIHAVISEEKIEKLTAEKWRVYAKWWQKLT
jgi:hypothetical protein